MALSLLLQRKGRALYAADGLAEAELEALPQGVALKATVTRPRSNPQHRLYFAMLKLVADNTDLIAGSDELHQLVKEALGYSRTVRRKNGHLVTVHGSIAFEKMDGIAFNAFMGKATAFLCEEVIPNLGKEELVAQAKEMLGQ